MFFPIRTPFSNLLAPVNRRHFLHWNLFIALIILVHQPSLFIHVTNWFSSLLYMYIQLVAEILKFSFWGQIQRQLYCLKTNFIVFNSKHFSRLIKHGWESFDNLNSRWSISICYMMKTSVKITRKAKLILIAVLAYY